MVGFMVAVSFIATLLMYLLCVASGKQVKMSICELLKMRNKPFIWRSITAEKREKRKGIIRFKIGMP